MICAVNWDAAMLDDDDWVYHYGTETAPGWMRFAHVSRTSPGGGRQYWTGSAWSTDPATSTRLLSGVGETFAVVKLPPLYVLFTRQHNLPYDNQLVAYTALSPTGPFDGPHHHGAVPERLTVQPDPARGKLTIAHTGQVQAGWPFSPRSSTPPAPAGLTATAVDDHADLSWDTVDTATAYRIYQRDVTGGQTHVARLPTAPTSSSHRLWHLIPGHTYEFRVATVAGATEGPMSDIATAAPHSTRRAADVIHNAGVAQSIAGSYMINVREYAVSPEGLAPFLDELVSQYGGTLTAVYGFALHGGAAAMTEAQAVDLAAHPDVDDIEQDMRMEMY